MSFKTVYQLDSNLQQIENQEPLEDSPAVVNQAIPNNILQAANTTKELDTTFGINNDVNIPVRVVNVQLQESQPENKSSSKHEQHHTKIASWQTLLLLFCLFLVAFVKAFSNSRFKQSTKALFSYSVAQEITREEKVFFHRANLIFTTICIITSSLLIGQINLTIQPFSYENSPLYFLTIAGFITVMFCVKFLFSKILFFVFNDSSISTEYTFNIALFNSFFGISLLPVITIVYFTTLDFTTILTYIALPLLIIFLVMRVVRLFTIGISKGVSYIYIFLYICTLEILPLVVLFRFFVLV